MVQAHNTQYDVPITCYSREYRYIQIRHNCWILICTLKARATCVVHWSSPVMLFVRHIWFARAISILFCEMLFCNTVFVNCRCVLLLLMSVLFEEIFKLHIIGISYQLPVKTQKQRLKHQIISDRIQRIKWSIIGVWVPRQSKNKYRMSEKVVWRGRVVGYGAVKVAF